MSPATFKDKLAIIGKILLKKLIRCYNCVALRTKPSDLIQQPSRFSQFPYFSNTNCVKPIIAALATYLFPSLLIHAEPLNHSFPVEVSKPTGWTPSLPTLPIHLGEKGNLSLSEQATQYHFTSDQILIKANAGWGYIAQGSGVVGLDMASMMGDTSAVGLNLNYQQDRVEAVLHHVKYWVPVGWRWKGAVSYLHGRQQFNFFRSSETARLSQLAYYGSVDWLDTGKLDLGLQSLGVSSWGGKSKNHSQFNELNYIDDTPDYFLITRDARQLSEGRLFGAALDFQYAAGTYLNWVFRGSLGREWLRFPYSDGSTESHQKWYADARVDYQLDQQSVVNLSYKLGVIENRVELGWQRGAMGLSGFYSQGQNGLENQYGVRVNLDLLALFNKAKQIDDDPIAIKMRPLRHAARESKINSAQLLQEAILRPIQLPTNFMVKVDPSAVKQIRVEKATLPSNANISPEGNIYIPVTQGLSSIVTAQVNGQPVNNIALQFGVEGNQLVVFAQNLPKPATTDNYTVRVQDGTSGNVYIVTFKALAG